MKLNNILYMINNFNYFYTLTEKEQTILKNYDVFRFYEILLWDKEIKKFEEVLLKYLTLIKLNGYNVTYKYIINKYPYAVDFNYNDIEGLYKRNILSLNDIMDIKNILLNNFSNSIKNKQYFYFKSYNEAKNFLKDINKTSRIFKYYR